MMALYKVNYLFVLVMNKPKFISKPLGVLVKNDIIEVLNFYNNWAYFKYNDTDAYIPSYSLIQLVKEDDIKIYDFFKIYNLNVFSSSIIPNSMYYSPSSIIFITTSN